MAIGTGPLLRSDSLKNYTPLGEEGNPVYKWATQIRVAIRRNIGAENINVFAIPQTNEDGDILDWYAPETGSVVPWSSATRDEQISAKEQLAEIQNKLSATENKSSSTEDDEKTVFKRLLKHVLQFPDDQHVYLVNDKPVITFWGFINTDSAPRTNPLTLLKIPELASPTIDAIPIHDSVVETIPVKRRSLWWWLLLLPLLLLLLFFLLRACSPSIQLPAFNPSIDLGDLSRPEVDIDVDPSIEIPNGISGNIDTPDIHFSPNATEIPALPEMTLPELNPEEEEAIGELPEQVSEPIENTLEEQSEQLPESLQQTPEIIPAEIPETVPNPEPPPQQALEIPESSSQNKSLEFLDGNWQANSGLMDAQGRPVNLEYDFNNGKGNVRIRKNDGTVCSGKVVASMNGSELGFSDTGKIKCPDGKSFQPAKVQCKINSANQTVCEGSYKNGAKFNMDVTKAAEIQK